MDPVALVGAPVLVILIAWLGKQGWGRRERLPVLRRRALANKLSELGCRRSLEHVRALFGPATTTFRDGLPEDHVGYVFEFPDALVQVVVDRDQSVQLYSVTTRSEGFQPAAGLSEVVGQPEVRLGDTRFSEIGHQPSGLQSTHAAGWWE